MLASGSSVKKQGTYEGSSSKATGIKVAISNSQKLSDGKWLLVFLTVGRCGKIIGRVLEVARDGYS